MSGLSRPHDEKLWCWRLKSCAEPLNEETHARSGLIHSIAHWGLHRDVHNEISRSRFATDIHSACINIPMSLPSARDKFLWTTRYRHFHYAVGGVNINVANADGARQKVKYYYVHSIATRILTEVSPGELLPSTQNRVRCVSLLVTISRHITASTW